MITRKLEYETGLPDSKSAIRLATGSSVPPFWVFRVSTSPIQTEIGQLAS